MSNDTQLTRAQEARIAALWDEHERLVFSGTLNLILDEANRITRAEDCGQEADTSELEYLLGIVGDLVGTVRAAVLGMLVEAEEYWDGIENAPEDYYSAYQYLRSLRSEVELTWKHAKALSCGVSI